MCFFYITLLLIAPSVLLYVLYQRQLAILSNKHQALMQSIIVKPAEQRHGYAAAALFRLISLLRLCNSSCYTTLIVSTQNSAKLGEI